MRIFEKPIYKYLSFINNKSISTSRKIEIYQKYYLTLHITKEDYPEILNLFWKGFTAHEPCFVASGLSKEPVPCFEDAVIKCLKQGYSLMSVSKNTGRIVGAAINAVSTTNTSCENMKRANKCHCPKTAELINFYNYIHNAPCLFCKCRTPIIFELCYLMVLPSDSGRFVGYNLAKDTRNLFLDLQFPVLRVDCTSEFSARILKSLGSLLVWKKPYSCFRRPDGTQLYKPPKPHKIIRVFIDYPKLQNTC